MAEKPATPMNELEALELEERRLRLELMRDQVAAIQAKKDEAARTRRDQAATEAFNRRKQQIEQDNCPHKKGGRGIEGIFAGNSSDYSVIKQTEPWGETYVKCQRCGKEWRDPFFMMRKVEPSKVAEAKKKDPRGYELIMKAYREALDFPTDNSPSGGAIFGIQREVDFTEANV